MHVALAVAVGAVRSPRIIEGDALSTSDYCGGVGHVDGAGGIGGVRHDGMPAVVSYTSIGGELYGQ